MQLTWDQFKRSFIMIFGFVGFIGSGKNAAADFLVDRHRFVKESFAKPVKDAVSSIFGWDRVLLEGDSEFSRNWREMPDRWWSKRMGKDFTPRLALQLMGTEAGRNVFYPNLWVDALFRRIDASVNHVISDVRFPNEIEAIRKAGGKIYRIQRGKDPNWFQLAIRMNKHMEQPIQNNEELDLLNEIYKVHYSERAWIGSTVDGTIQNNGTLDDFHNKLDMIIYQSIVNS